MKFKETVGNPVIFCKILRDKIDKNLLGVCEKFELPNYSNEIKFSKLFLNS